MENVLLIALETEVTDKNVLKLSDYSIIFSLPLQQPPPTQQENLTRQWE